MKNMLKKTQTPFSLNFLTIDEDFFSYSSIKTPIITFLTLKELSSQTPFSQLLLEFIGKNPDFELLFKNVRIFSEKNNDKKSFDELKINFFLLMEEISSKLYLLFEETWLVTLENFIKILHFLIFCNFLILNEELPVQTTGDFLLFLMIFYKKNNTLKKNEISIEFYDIINFFSLSITRQFLSLNSSKSHYIPNKTLKKFSKNADLSIEELVIKLETRNIEHIFEEKAIYEEKKIKILFFIINFFENRLKSEKNEEFIFLKNLKKITKFIVKNVEFSSKETRFWNFEKQQKFTFFELILSKFADKIQIKEFFLLKKLFENVFKVKENCFFSSLNSLIK